VGAPLLRKALNGQVGILIAYGQTGSGKTTSLFGLLDKVADALFAEPGGGPIQGRVVTFSYIEMFGEKDVRDGLSANGAAKVTVGEGSVDGRVFTKGLSMVALPDLKEMRRLVGTAKARRAASTKCDDFSRSHGLIVIRVGPPSGMGCSVCPPEDGLLYFVDLAGSVRSTLALIQTITLLSQDRFVFKSLQLLFLLSAFLAYCNVCKV
jgi:hypothetical protein